MKAVDLAPQMDIFLTFTQTFIKKIFVINYKWYRTNIISKYNHSHLLVSNEKLSHEL